MLTFVIPYNSFGVTVALKNYQINNNEDVLINTTKK